MEVTRVRRWSGFRRGAAIVLAGGLAVIVAAAVLGSMAAAAPLGFLHIRSNLSGTALLDSAYPDLAVSPDGKRVAVVWTEGYGSFADFRGHVYLRAAAETGGGWGSRITVFRGDSFARAYDAAVAVMSDTAHVAYAVLFFDAGGFFIQAKVRYETCSLTSMQCGGWQDVSESLDPYLITQVDIALDEAGDPHVVWTRCTAAGDKGDIWYNARSAGTWGSNPKWVDEVPNNVDSEPAIAWADGYAHVVWKAKHTGAGGNLHYIRYRRVNKAGTWESIIPLVNGERDYPPGNPDVAAGAGRAFVVWDWCNDIDRAIRGYCQVYRLVYWRSDRPTEIQEVGTNRTAGMADYYSIDDKMRFPDNSEYLLDLKPSIALNKDGWPAVVWHSNHGGEGEEMSYAVYYSYAITGTGDGSVDWITTTTVLSQSQPLMAGSAAIGVGTPRPAGEQPLHIAYMQQLGTGYWDVYYDSNEKDRYGYLYLPIIMRTG